MGQTIAWIEHTWLRYQRTLLWLAIALMIAASLHRLPNEFHRLLFDQGESGAIDLKFRYNDVQRWFSGLPVYTDEDAIYPPASYLMLWPFLGWLSQDHARWLWAITSIAAMVWLMSQLLQQSAMPGIHRKGENPSVYSVSRQKKIFVALLVPSIYATSATIGNGQLILHLLPFLLAALFQNQRQSSWKSDLLTASCFLIALMKPAIAVPFFFLILFCPGRLRPVFLVIGGYLLLTVFAIIPQGFRPGSLISEWLARGSAAAVRGGYANLHSWLVALELQRWILPASLLLLILLGIWIFRNRKNDYWILLGITAYFARFWIYHRLYDDMLVLIPMIALFRISTQHSMQSTRVGAGAILAITWAAALAPARLQLFPPPYNVLFEISQTVTWMIGFIFLFCVAKKKSE